MYLIQSANPKRTNLEEVQIFQILLIKSSFLVCLVLHATHSQILPQLLSFTKAYQTIIIFGAYTVICEAVSWCYFRPNLDQSRKVSKLFTILWHVFFITTTLLYSLVITNQNPTVFPHYFKTRIGIYCYCCTNIINNLHIIKNPIVFQKQFLIRLKQYYRWQLQHYQYPLYCIIFGFLMDFICFGTQRNLILLLLILGLTILYKFAKHFARISGWQKLKTAFTTE